MTVALDGTLWQDLGLYSADHFKHSQEADRFVPTHGIEITEGSILEKVLGPKAKVNSYHHQSVKAIARGGEVIATSADGIIEAVDWSTPHHYCLGVQWHPENMAATNPQMLALFQSFIQASTQKKEPEA